MIRTRTQEHTHSKGDHLGDVEGEGATNASSEVNAAMSGRSMHLASDLPDPLTSSSEERVAGEAPIVEESMGANGSHEVNANLHSSVAQLQGVKAQASAREQKDGKLRKPSKSGKNFRVDTCWLS